MYSVVYSRILYIIQCLVYSSKLDFKLSLREQSLQQFCKNAKFCLIISSMVVGTTKTMYKLELCNCILIILSIYHCKYIINYGIYDFIVLFYKGRAHLHDNTFGLFL